VRLPYELREDNNEQAVFVGPDGAYTMPEVSGLLLGYLRQCAELFLGDAVTSAVITVPVPTMYAGDGRSAHAIRHDNGAGLGGGGIDQLQ